MTGAVSCRLASTGAPYPGVEGPVARPNNITGSVTTCLSLSLAGCHLPRIPPGSPFTTVRVTESPLAVLELTTLLPSLCWPGPASLRLSRCWSNKALEPPGSPIPITNSLLFPLTMSLLLLLSSDR